MLELTRIERAKLMMADPMWVSQDVKDLIESAALSWQPEALKVDDVFPNLYGFVLFPEPFVVRDVHNKRLAFRAIAWEPIGPDGWIAYDAYDERVHPRDATGVMLSAYSHIDDDDDYPLVASTGVERSELPVMSLCYVTPWSFNGQTPIDMSESGLLDFCKITQVMWRMAQQQVTVHEGNRLPRPERRRAERTGLQSDVVVVRLRHAKLEPEHGSGEPNEVEWSCRWMVKGHWRNQYYPSIKDHRQVWINSHVKGPEDAPLVLKPMRAYEFDR